MREILFRGKRIDNDEFVYGSLYVCGRKDGKYEIANYDRHLNIERFAYEVLPETVGQYTGLADKNGKKIFEGDIVRDKSLPIVCGIGVIEFGDYEMRMNSSLINDNYSYHIGFYVKWIGIVDYRKDLAFWHNKIEVIGNIHDNPELLKEADDE